jgi:hypothetical protein
MATSAVKIAANRANATHSTGPADTSRTRFNGLAHGLTSKQTVVRGESQDEYNQFAGGLLQNLAPASAIEAVLADRLIAAAWRLQRFTRVESAFFTNRIDAYLESNPDSDPDAALANLFVDPAETSRMRLFMRYQNAVQREYDKAFKEFQSAKADRQKQDEVDLPADCDIAPHETPAFHGNNLTPSVASEVGFASQPTPAAA